MFGVLLFIMRLTWFWFKTIQIYFLMFFLFIFGMALIHHLLYYDFRCQFSCVSMCFYHYFFLLMHVNAYFFGNGNCVTARCENLTFTIAAKLLVGDVQSRFCIECVPNLHSFWESLTCVSMCLIQSQTHSMKYFQSIKSFCFFFLFVFRKLIP